MQAVPINLKHRLDRLIIMNSATVESPAARSSAGPATDELTQLKKDLMQAEVRLAKARATVTGAEIDIRVLNARLKAYAK